MKLKTYATLAVVGAAIVVLVGLEARARRAENRVAKLEQAAAKSRLEAVARDERYGAVLGQLATEKAIVKTLTDRQLELLKAARRADPGVRVDSKASTTIAIADVTPGTATVTPAQAECVDEYNRFHVIIPSTGECSVQRRQLFSLTQLFIRSTDGKTRIAQTDFREFDPVTKQVIPTTGIDLKAEYTFADEVAPNPPFLKLRPLAGLDHRRAFAAGVEALNLERTGKPILERLTLGGMGYWKPGTDLRLAVRAGYRLVGNISLGGYYGWSVPKLVPVVGADVTVRLGN